MNDIFTLRVRAAARAGWWVCISMAALISVQYLFVMHVSSTHPAWFVNILGGNLDWLFIQKLCLTTLVALKLILWVVIIVTLWLSLLARQLLKR